MPRENNTTRIAQLLDTDVRGAVLFWQDVNASSCVHLSTAQVLRMLLETFSSGRATTSPRDLCRAYGVSLEADSYTSALTFEQARFFESLEWHQQFILAWRGLSDRLPTMWPLMRDEAKRGLVRQCLAEQAHLDALLSVCDASFLASLEPDGLGDALWQASPERLENLWPSLPHATREKLIQKCFDEGKHVEVAVRLCDDTLWASLDPRTQIDLVWQLPDAAFVQNWHRLDDATRVLAIYRAVHEHSRAGLLVAMAGDDIRFQTALSMLADIGGKGSDTAFQNGHRLFQDYVVETAWWSTESLDFTPLLPRCYMDWLSGVRHCEGRAWPTEEDRTAGAKRASRAFCPRTRSECQLASEATPDGARIYPLPALPWEEWSLAELMDALNIEPRLPELRSPQEYVPRLSGWINRLNEIRSRLKCSVCGQLMRPHLGYAKNLARYNVTVVSCVRGEGHDNNIYFNHCWGCKAIIDSRESRFRVEGFYICIHCGSGPPESLTYSQGDVCPACGCTRMQASDDYSGRMECTSCHHTIRLPPKHNLTGKGSLSHW